MHWKVLIWIGVGAGAGLLFFLLTALLAARPWQGEARRDWLGRLRLPLFLAALYFMGSQVLRIVLMAVFWPKASASWGDLIRAAVTGIHVDAVVALVQASAVAIWCLARKNPWTGAARRGLMALVAVEWGIRCFLFVSEFYFFDEFTSRFNTVAIDYLIYPHEVFTNLQESYPLPAILLGVTAGAAAVTWVAFRLAPPTVPREGEAPVSRFHRWGYVAAWLVLLTALVATIRPSETAFSAERTVNEIANNGLASGARAAWTRHLDYAAFYPSMSVDDAVARARRLLASPDATFPAPPAPPEPTAGPDGKIDPVAYDEWLGKAAASLQRRIAGDPNRPRLNVCILVQESLGSEFWGSLGRKRKSGKPDTCTPRMDRMAAEEGLLFTNLYADGNRTIRGLEAIFSSFPPLPGDSILARDRTENVETLARVLKRDGYQSVFFYGGKGTFDYIESYALPNGWDRLVQEWDFKEVSHRTAWGVCDDDVYRRIIEEMRTMHASGQPFLASCMTVSNHLPFTYPEGRIDLKPNEPKKDGRENVVKYCDWALGDFFDRAKKEPFWNDTVFVVVADHGARVYGSETIPIKSYEIPLLIVGPAVVKEPKRIDTLGCQLDVTPTLLGLIGRPYDSLFFGHDLLRQTDPAASRCLMHHNRSIAIYRDERQVVLGLNKDVEYWVGNPRIPDLRRTTQPDPMAKDLEADATALFQVADMLYLGRKYRVQTLPATAP